MRELRYTPLAAEATLVVEPDPNDVGEPFRRAIDVLERFAPTAEPLVLDLHLACREAGLRWHEHDAPPAQPWWELRAHPLPDGVLPPRYLGGHPLLPALRAPLPPRSRPGFSGPRRRSPHALASSWPCPS